MGKDKNWEKDKNEWWLTTVNVYFKSYLEIAIIVQLQ